jgi:hypothetical protein
MSTPRQDQRQRARQAGRYAPMATCPRCGKRRALEPAYTKSEGGTVRDGSPWAGQILCPLCIRQEA